MSTELSGVDLARQALVAAQEAEKKNGNQPRGPAAQVSAAYRIWPSQARKA